MNISKNRLTAISTVAVCVACAVSIASAQSSDTTGVVIESPVDFYQSVASKVVKEIAASQQARAANQNADTPTQDAQTAPAVDPSADPDQAAAANTAGQVTASQQAAETDETDAAASQQVELSSDGGLVTVEGVIVDFDDDLVTIEASFGIVSIERAGLECIGAACPEELLAASQTTATD